MGDVFDQAASPTSAGASGDVFDQAAVAGSPILKAHAPGGFWSDLGNTLSSGIGAAVSGEDTNAPLTSHGAATGQGILNVVQGISQGVQAIPGMVKTAAKAAVNPAGAGLDVGNALVEGGKQATDVPGAVRDINASPDPLGTYAQVAGKTAGQGAGQALVAAATEGVRLGGARAIKAVKGISDVPAAMNTDATSTLAEVAHNEGLRPITASTAREAAGQFKDALFEKAQDFYKPVDKAVGGNLKPVQQRISELETAYELQKNVRPDLASSYLKELATQNQTLGKLVAQAQANGVPNAEALMAKGDSYFSRAMNMKKVESGIKTASGSVKMGGHPNPHLFATQMDRLENVGSLQKALGPDGAKALQDVAREGLRKGKTAAAVNVAKKYAIRGAAGAAGVTTVGGVAYGIKKALSGE